MRGKRGSASPAVTLHDITHNTFIVFFFNDTATTEIYPNLNTLSLHDALPISEKCLIQKSRRPVFPIWENTKWHTMLYVRSEEHTSELQSHSEISYAVFCLKKKKKNTHKNQYEYKFNKQQKKQK